jgi:hypothetical protein
MAINYKNYLTSSITTATVVYNPTAAGIQATLVGLSISNTSSTQATITVSMTDGVTTASIITNAVIPVGTTLNVVDASRLIVAQNNFISVTANNTVDVIVSAIEVT